MLDDSSAANDEELVAHGCVGGAFSPSNSASRSASSLAALFIKRFLDSLSIKSLLRFILCCSSCLFDSLAFRRSSCKFFSHFICLCKAVSFFEIRFRTRVLAMTALLLIRPTGLLIVPQMKED